MREIVFFTSREDCFSENLYNEMVDECMTPKVINSKTELSRYIKNKDGSCISLLFIINDEKDLSFLRNLKQYLYKVVFIVFNSNKEIIREALSFNPSLVLLSNNNLNKNISVMEKILKL